VAGDDGLHRVDLHLEPNEASDLTPVHEPGLLAAHGWDAAYLTVLDEGPVEDCVAVLGHAAGAGPVEGWSSERISFDAGDMRGRTEDAEAVCVRDGTVYVIGSHFGSKDGPLQPKRHWLARFDHDGLERGLQHACPSLEVVRTKFRLHRAVNDALRAAPIDLFALDDDARDVFVGAARRDGRKRGKGWLERLAEDDLPINVEGATFLPDGALLLGLRFPTTADGRPLLVELPDVDALFAGETPSCRSVWWLEPDGAPGGPPLGVRALDGEHVVLGSLDALGKDSALVAAHPEAGEAGCRHVRHDPLPPGGGPVPTELVHDFGGLRSVEGVAEAPEGHVLYVVDEDAHVEMRFLLER
jgi:hypothetical protein